jgi:hypothetical protein
MSKAEELATWYLRLNGFLTISNFILHPSCGGSQRTDADVIGVRFPFRREFEGDHDDVARLGCSSTKPTLLIAEVKTTDLSLNEAWQNPDKGNINKVLTDLGLFKSKRSIDVAAKRLYESGRHDGEYYCSLLLIGNVNVGKIPTQYSAVPTVLWKDAIGFIHTRFRMHRREKAQHDQWDTLGQELYQFAIDHESLADFERDVRRACRLQPSVAI